MNKIFLVSDPFHPQVPINEMDEFNLVSAVQFEYFELLQCFEACGKVLPETLPNPEIRSVFSSWCSCNVCFGPLATLAAVDDVEGQKCEVLEVRDVLIIVSVLSLMCTKITALLL